MEVVVFPIEEAQLSPVLLDRFDLDDGSTVYFESEVVTVLKVDGQDTRFDLEEIPAQLSAFDNAVISPTIYPEPAELPSLIRHQIPSKESALNLNGYKIEITENIKELPKKVFERVSILYELDRARKGFHPRPRNVMTWLASMQGMFRQSFDNYQWYVHPKMGSVVSGEIDPEIDVIFEELVNNASKYRAEPDKNKRGNTVELGFNIRGDNVVFEVLDNGIGIPFWDIPGVFEPGKRGVNAKEKDGTGSGLFLLKKMVETREGEVNLEIFDPISNSFAYFVASRETDYEIKLTGLSETPILLAPDTARRIENYSTGFRVVLPIHKFFNNTN